MAASPEAMQGKPPATPPQAGPAEPPPGGAPMLSPQKKEGDREGSAVNVALAMKLLERSMAAFGTGDPKGASILKALAALGKAFGKQESSTEELTPAEKMQMLQGLAGPGAPPQSGKPPQAGGAPPQPGAQ